jgi:hypothetical protein
MDWFFHMFGLKSPREMRQIEREFHRDTRLGELELARAIAEGLTGERREIAMARIVAAEQQEEINHGIIQ